jgi:MIP family channel proteins
VSEGLGRRCAAEVVGTFGIVFPPVALSAAASHAGADSSLLAAALVSGFAVLAMIYALGHISAAHFNPAVTLAFASAGRFPWRCVLPYAAAQLLGGTAAAGAVALLLGPGHGAHVPSVDGARAVGAEILLTFLLMLVIISVATDRRVNSAIPGLAIGLTVVLDVLIGGALTGGSMNPARSLGPALFAGGPALASSWVYVAGPVTGALAAARLYELLRGGDEHAQGAPNDLFVALERAQHEAERTG